MRASRLASACAIALSCLFDDRALPAQTAEVPSVQTFDQPSEGARSPRNASYDIRVVLDHVGRTLRGDQTIHWRNISNRSTSELRFHLHWNAWRDDAGAWSEITQLRVKQPDGRLVELADRQRFTAGDGVTASDRAVVAVPLPWEVGPYESVEIALGWRAKIPRPSAGTGDRGDSYFIAHWFPAIGVLEDDGWNPRGFRAGTGVYADYGSYDVQITVPAGFVVGATGAEVLRLENRDGTVMHRYRADDVHDFAWTASPRFVESRRTFEDGTAPPVDMRLLLQPEHAGQENRHFAAAAAALRSYGEWYGSYPYRDLTIVDPAYQSGIGGMAYPMLITVGTRWLAPRGVMQPESATIRQTGHQWWYGVISNTDARLDDELNAYSTARVIEEAFEPTHVVQRYFGGFIPWVFEDIPLPRATTPWLHTLERHLGRATLQRALALYFERWQFRHPRPDDFLAAVNDASGRDMTWFFAQVRSNAFDYGIEQLTSTRDGGRHRTTVVVRRHGNGTFPVEVVTTFADRSEARERWDGLDSHVVYTYERESAAVSSEVDPARVLLLDRDPVNNSRTREPRSREAATRWTLQWVAWLQNLLLTYAFVV